MVSNEGSFFSSKTDQLVNFDKESKSKSPTQKEPNKSNENPNTLTRLSPDILLP